MKDRVKHRHANRPITPDPNSDASGALRDVVSCSQTGSASDSDRLGLRPCRNLPGFRMRIRPFLPASLALLACSALVTPARANETLPGTPAEPAPVDKSGYHLFNPTPRELMREMSTDRPDKTESAYTVDAGHFQIEMDVFTFSRDRDKTGGGDVQVDSWAIAPMNLKVGLCNSVDLQTVIETYNTIETKDRVAGTKDRQSGFGDITSRLKVNLWGNDGGTTALAVMPYAKFPTNQDRMGNKSVEGGIIVPLAVELPAGFGMAIMPQFDFVKDGDLDGYHVEFVNTLTVGHAIVGDLGMYVEFFSAVSEEEDSPWVGTFDVGFTYGLTPDIQLDAGVNIGVTDSADDINPFLGISLRF